jgi:hypothetical protein
MTVPVEAVPGSDSYPLRWLVSVDDGEVVYPSHAISRSTNAVPLIMDGQSALAYLTRSKAKQENVPKV